MHVCEDIRRYNTSRGGTGAGLTGIFFKNASVRTPAQLKRLLAFDIYR